MPLGCENMISKMIARENHRSYQKNQTSQTLNEKLLADLLNGANRDKKKLINHYFDRVFLLSKKEREAFIKQILQDDTSEISE